MEKIKPPLGIMPEIIWIEKRIDDIEYAIKRYQKAQKIIPLEWFLELERHKNMVLILNDSKVPYSTAF